MIDSGCTALAETWEVVQGEASANHFMLGYVVSWLTEHVAGLRPGHGWTSVVVEPHGVDLVDHAAVGYDSRVGTYEVAWSKGSGGVALEIAVPTGGAAVVRAPAGWQVSDDASALSGGRHQVRLTRVPAPGAHP
jgi:hypothetical protein